MTVCAKHGCKDMASVRLERDGRAYCRPHGLAEALRLPRCDVRPLAPPLTAEEDTGR